MVCAYTEILSNVKQQVLLPSSHLIWQPAPVSGNQTLYVDVPFKSESPTQQHGSMSMSLLKHCCDFFSALIMDKIKPEGYSEKQKSQCHQLTINCNDLPLIMFCMIYCRDASRILPWNHLLCLRKRCVFMSHLEKLVKHAKASFFKPGLQRCTSSEHTALALH